MVQATILSSPTSQTVSAPAASGKVHGARSAAADNQKPSSDEKFTLGKESKAPAPSASDANVAAPATAQREQNAEQQTDDNSSLDDVMALVASLSATHEAAQQPLTTSPLASSANGQLGERQFDPLAKLQAANQTNPLSSFGAASSTLTDSSPANANLLAQLQTSAKLTPETVDKNLFKLAVASGDGQSALPAANAALLSGALASTGHSQALSSAPASALTPTTGAEWASVRVDTSAGKWGEQMLQVLQDRVTLQAQQNLHEAKIRLDPPELGKLDLLVRVEGDRLSVQIHSNTAVTREALMQISERLRHELQNQNFMHVDVNIGSGERGQSGQSSAQEEDNAPIFAARGRQDGDVDFASSSPQSEHWLTTQA